MKKLLLIPLLLLFINAGFVESEEMIRKLTGDICDLILDHQKQLKKRGFRIEDLFWTSYNYFYHESKTSYDMYLDKGTVYVFYTRTTGAFVSVYVKKDDNTHTSQRSNWSNRIIFFYTAPESGDYHYYVEGHREVGIHVSYGTKIIKEDI